MAASSVLRVQRSLIEPIVLVDVVNWQFLNVLVIVTAQLEIVLFSMAVVCETQYG